MTSSLSSSSWHGGQSGLVLCVFILMLLSLVRVESDTVTLSHHYIASTETALTTFLTFFYRRNQFAIRLAVDTINTMDTCLQSFNTSLATRATEAKDTATMVRQVGTDYLTDPSPQVFFGVYTSVNPPLGECMVMSMSMGIA